MDNFSDAEVVFVFMKCSIRFMFEQTGDALYVLMCCWLAAVGAGLLKSEEILEGVARLRISDDIEFEEQTFIATMAEAREVSQIQFCNSFLGSEAESRLKMMNGENAKLKKWETMFTNKIDF